MRLYRRLAVAVMLSATGLFAQAPAPTTVLNPASNVLPGLPNYGIAQGSIFVVYGSNLGPSKIATAPAIPLGTSLSGTSVQISVGGASVAAPIVYTLNTQVAAVLPSSVPVGSGTLTLTYNGASGSTPIQVVKSNFGISTVNETGTGPAVVTFGDYSVVTNAKSAKAGDKLVLWGTGLGPITGDDSAAPTPVDLGTPITVYVGGVQANIAYRGRSVEPGLDQINFTVPDGVTGCAVSVVVQTGNMVSNTTTMAVAQDNGACSDANGISYSSLAPVLNAKGSVSIGLIDLFQESSSISIGGTTTPQNLGSASAIFEKFTPTQIADTGSLLGQASIGSCTVSSFSSNSSPPAGSGSTPSAPGPPVTNAGLDAGAAITITPPSGSPITLSTNSSGGKGFYSGTLTSLPAGTYTISNGAGGADVGAFSKSVTLSAALQWTNQTAVTSAPIDRTQPLTLTWTGGDPSRNAFIEGSSSTLTGTTGTSASFFCIGPVAAGKFTVSPAVLLALPPTGTSPGAFGLLTVGSSSNPVTFSAPGIDYGFIVNGGGNGAAVTFK